MYLRSIVNIKLIKLNGIFITPRYKGYIFGRRYARDLYITYHKDQWHGPAYLINKYNAIITFNEYQISFTEFEKKIIYLEDHSYILKKTD